MEIMRAIKINTKAITKEGFNFKMDKAPDFFMIKMQESKLYYDALGIYISAEDAASMGMSKLVEIVNDYNFIFNNNN